MLRKGKDVAAQEHSKEDQAGNLPLPAMRGVTQGASCCRAKAKPSNGWRPSSQGLDNTPCVVANNFALWPISWRRQVGNLMPRITTARTKGQVCAECGLEIQTGERVASVIVYLSPRRVHIGCFDAFKDRVKGEVRSNLGKKR